MLVISKQNWERLFLSRPSAVLKGRVARFSCLCRGLGLLLHLQQVLHLLGAGGLFVLQQVGVAFGHTPALWRGQGWALGATGCGHQILPVLTAGPGGDTQSWVGH